MPAQVYVLAGPARSGKTAALLARYRQVLAEQGGGSLTQGALWLAPTRHATAEIRGRILNAELTGCFDPGVYTLEQFAQSLLLAADRPPRYLGQLLKRQLIRQLLAGALAEGRLSYFAPIADTAGLVDLIGGVISDLKRQEVSPEQLSQLAAAAAGSEKTREIATLYAEYQGLLDKHHLYDIEGRFPAAGKVLRETPPEAWGPLAGVRHLVLDGFTDFTRSQHEVLQLLATKLPALKALIITLPLEKESERADLFLKPRLTLEELQKRHPAVAIHWQPRPATDSWPALAHLERHLFANPRDAKPAADTARIEIIATSGQKAEIQWLARSIKHLLVLGETSSAEHTANGTANSLVTANLSTNANSPAASAHRPVRPGDVAVVFRSLEPVAALVEEVFSEYGIPVAIDWPPRMSRSPVLQSLLALLRMHAGDWPFRQLLAVVANNYFQPPWPEWQSGEAATAVEWAIRQLQVPVGRKELLAALQRRSKSAAAASSNMEEDDLLDESDVQRREQHRQRYEVAYRLLSQLDKMLPSPGKARPLAEWMGILQGVVDHVGLLGGVEDNRENLGGAAARPDSSAAAEPQEFPSFSRYDQQAWQRLKNALAAATQLDKTLTEEPTGLTLQDFIARLQDILSVEALPVELDATGRVRVLAASSVRAISVPYLFVAGLAEKVFPPPMRDDRIYTEAEYRQLNQVGLNFADSRQRSSEEMLLFYEVVTRATRQLVLSYPALDETAQPLSASPFVTELQYALGLSAKLEISLSPVPHRDKPPYSPTELRLKTVDHLLQTDSHWSARLLEDMASTNWPPKQLQPLAAFPGVLAGLQSIAARSGRESFGPFEGLLAGAAVKRQLQQRFGPEHCWSVSRLEEYANCPYQFFARNVLKLEELPELTLDVDYGRRGRLAHDALAMLHRQLMKSAERLSPADIHADQYVQFANEAVQLLSEKNSPGSPLEVALQTVDLQLIAQWLQEYLPQHQEYDAAAAQVESAAGKSTADQPLRPAYFEVSFGLKPRESPEIDNQLSTDKPFDLRCGEETIRLSGRIDRIDVGRVGSQVVFNLLDYKTGAHKRLKLQDFQSGVALQLPLYALAVQDLLMIDRRAVPWRVGYWYVREKGFDSHGLPQLFESGVTGATESAQWQSLREEILARVAALVRGVRGGLFPVFSADLECTGRCEFSTVCRVHQIRSLGKLWPEISPTTIASPKVMEVQP